MPAYTVYGGNPARLLKNRFDAELTDLLLRFRWWELPPEALAETLPLLCDSDLERVKQTLRNRLAGLALRNERPEDWDAVELLIRDAFWNEHVPGASEPYLAHRMRRHPDFVPELSMVAELDGKLVGSILYTVSTLTAGGRNREKMPDVRPHRRASGRSAPGHRAGADREDVRKGAGNGL